MHSSRSKKKREKSYVETTPLHTSIHPFFLPRAYPQVYWSVYLWPGISDYSVG